MTAYKKIIAIFAAISAGAFFILRFFLVKERPSVDSFPQGEKNAAKKQIKQLEQDLSQVEGKEYSDKEIEDKFNK